VRVSINGLRKENPGKKSFAFRLSDYSFNKILSVTHSFPARELSPDYYEIKVTLLDKNDEFMDERKAGFVISPAQAIPHPIARAKIIPLTNNFLFYYMLGRQYGKVGENDKAEENFERGYRSRPDYKNGVIEYADFLFKVKKFDRSLELIEDVKEDEKLKFEYYFIKGKAFMGMGKYPEAIDNLLEGNKIYNSDTSLLNSLGFCYYKTEQREKALDALKASLKLNSEQEEIRKLINEIEKSRD